MKLKNHKTKLGRRFLRPLPKVMLHEHLDCSLRPGTMLDLWEQIGFDKAKTAFPAEVLELRRQAGETTGGERTKLRNRAASIYQDFLVRFASESLANYVQAIVDHILPLMQTKENIARITRERIEDAARDGIIGLELRFAPQLHTWLGLTLDEVMDTVLAETRKAPFPVKLIVCALRHEGPEMARQLADLTVDYKKYVGVFDLAADEHANPGLLKWWLVAAIYALLRLPSLKVTIHLWETDEPTDQDIGLLKGFDRMVQEAKNRLGDRVLSCDELWALCEEVVNDLFAPESLSGASSDAGDGLLRVGHGIRGDRQGERVLEVCPTSNVVTGQVPSLADHPIDRLLKSGRKVTVNTDGTLFTRVQLTDEYALLVETFGWGLAELSAVNVNAANASSFSKREKQAMRAKIRRSYKG